tara:strand:- start:465 stop:1442 length:978 start_codon:yes stop_codon:yes gene_type:complete
MKAFNHRIQKLLLAVVMTVLGLTANAPAGLAQINSRDVPVVTQPQQRFNSGQDIQPIFEGWTRNEDGSYSFLFGYLNRNYAERPEIPVGEDNFFSPGEPDRGQPTYFYPRTNRYQFEVPVPADFPSDAELIWEVTRQGSTQRAYGWLQAEWEIDVNTITSNGRTQFGRGVEELYANAAPQVTVEASHETVMVGQPVTLTAMMTDDELPTAVPERDDDAPRRRRDPSLVAPDDAPEIPDNIPQYSKPYPTRNHMSVLWVVHRGPADGQFEPTGYQEWEEGMDGDGWTSGAVETVVTFSEAGSYTMRAFVSDAMLISKANLVITVTE